jgi:hypothetical protein
LYSNAGFLYVFQKCPLYQNPFTSKAEKGTLTLIILHLLALSLMVNRSVSSLVAERRSTEHQNTHFTFDNLFPKIVPFMR